MTANPRRPGFRLPWSSSEDEPAASNASPAEQQDTEEPASPNGHADEATPAVETNGATPAITPAEETTGAAQGSPAEAEDSSEFLRTLVAAMRKVAEEARASGIEELRTRAEAEVQRVEADAERRRTELQARAESDIAGVGEWAKAEAERIRREAEQRVAARRAQLEQELSAEQTRSESESQAVRDRVADYERELDAYHAQLYEITDPAAFAAAAKRMPKPPRLGAPGSSLARAEASAPSASTNGTVSTDEVHPGEEEVLAARLAELDDALGEEGGANAGPDSATGGSADDPVTTEVVVNGLGSFGAITGFRQALAGVDGIESVGLSLGQGGEFVFRATHARKVDLGAKIMELEGERAHLEPRAEGGLRVKLDRSR